MKNGKKPATRNPENAKEGTIVNAFLSGALGPFRRMRDGVAAAKVAPRARRSVQPARTREPVAEVARYRTIEQCANQHTYQTPMEIIYVNRNGPDGRRPATIERASPRGTSFSRVLECAILPFVFLSPRCCVHPPTNPTNLFLQNNNRCKKQELFQTYPNEYMRRK